MRNGKGRKGRLRAALALVAAFALQLLGAAPAEAVTGDIVVVDEQAYTDGRGGVMLVNRNSGGDRFKISENASPVGFPDFSQPLGLAVESDLELAVSKFFRNPNVGWAGVMHVETSSGNRTGFSMTNGALSLPAAFPANPFNVPYGIAVDLNGDLLVADTGSESIVRVDQSTGARTVVTSNSGVGSGPTFRDIRDVAVAANGDIIVSDTGLYCTKPGRCGGLFRVDPTTGARSFLASNKVIPPPPANLLFNHPEGITVDQDGYVLVANHATPSILKVNPVSGKVSFVSDNKSPGTPDFEGVNDLVSTGSDFDILVTDYEPTSATKDPKVIAVDPGTGAHGHVSDNNNPVGTPSFAYPWGIAYVSVAISSVQIQPPSFHPGTPGAPGGVVGRTAARGAAFRYRLAERAGLTVTLWRRVRGRIVANRCRRETRANRRGRACVRWLRVGSFSHQGRPGANSVRFSGRVARRALSPGRYRAVLTATTAGRFSSVPVAREFRVLAG